MAVVGLAIILHTAMLTATPAYPRWLGGYWAGIEPGTPFDLSFTSTDDPLPPAVLRFRRQRHIGTERPWPPQMRGVMTESASSRSAGRVVARWQVALGRNGLTLRLELPRQSGDQPFRLIEEPCPRPDAQAACFGRHRYTRPGPDVVELAREGNRLRTRIGFGPQHGAKVYEEHTYRLVPVDPDTGVPARD